jgi:small Trp-rich protein
MLAEKELPMPFIILIALLVPLRYFEVWHFGQISWWYIVGLMLAAFVWFEFIEKMLGLDKKKAHNEDAKRRKDRVNKSFDKRR